MASVPRRPTSWWVYELRLNSQMSRFESHENRRCTGSATLAPRSLPARVNMDRVAVTVVMQPDLLLRSFAAVLHLNTILGSAVAEGEDVAGPVLWQARLD